MPRLPIRATLFSFALAASLGLGLPVNGDVIYVDDDAPGGGDGMTWNTAFKYLQDALLGATAGDEIHVAQGIYKPDQDEAGVVTPGDREATFQLISGVGLHGGYRGCPGGDCSGDPDEQDVDAYETTLSGDLLGDDGPDFANYDENSYHVVTADGTDGTAVLDGITITAGNCSDSFGSGAGLHGSNGSPSIVACRFSRNLGGNHGGGVFLAFSSSNFVACTIDSNRAYEVGGGLWCQASHLQLTACAISGNESGGSAGGLFAMDGSTISIMDSSVVDNVAGVWSSTACGGGLRCYETDLTISNTLISGNSARLDGGGVLCHNGSLVAHCCTISNNYCGDGFGGGITQGGSGTLRVTDSLIENNTSYNGGGVDCGSSAEIIGCTIRGNTADDLVGGGVALFGSDSTISGCIIEGNDANDLGGGIYCQSSCLIERSRIGG
ncbi:MAG: right-handed parallel beta-helix repeat-containing protein, partial [Phycisphaerales bacterium]